MTADRSPEADETAPPRSREAANSWLEEHGDALFRYARLRVSRRELAEDLVQDTFVAALQSLDRYQGGSSVRTWLIAILRHKIIDHQRKVASGRAEPAGILEGSSGDFFADDDHWKRPPASWKTPDAIVEDSEFREVLDGCLDRMPRAIAAVFLLREMEGLETEELRRRLEISEGNLRVRLHRARLLLRECLQNRWFATTGEAR